MAAEAAAAGGRLLDARGWDEEGYRRSILMERGASSLTLFRAIFSPSPNNHRHLLLATASSDGSVASYSLSSSHSQPAHPIHTDHNHGRGSMRVDPICIVQAHTGPVYDLKFYGDSDDALLFSCGDDGHIRGWRWLEMETCLLPLPMQGYHMDPVLDLVNPQHEGPWGARSPIPENNAIAINKQEGSIFAAAGDACAYCWDVESGKCKMTFKGHSEYLHSIAVRKSNNQIITGSEDGTARVWDNTIDCRSGKCTQIIRPGKNRKFEGSSWVSCLDIDTSENWLACGTCSGLSVWSLLSNECIFNMDYHAPVQDVLFDKNQILAVGSEPVLSRFTMNGAVLSQIKCAPQSAFSVSVHSSGIAAVAGYGGLVDVISEFGSHFCTFGCRGFTESDS